MIIISCGTTNRVKTLISMKYAVANTLNTSPTPQQKYAALTQSITSSCSSSLKDFMRDISGQLSLIHSKHGKGNWLGQSKKWRKRRRQDQSTWEISFNRNLRSLVAISSMSSFVENRSSSFTMCTAFSVWPIACCTDSWKWTSTSVWWLLCIIHFDWLTEFRFYVQPDTK